MKLKSKERKPRNENVNFIDTNGEHISIFAHAFGVARRRGKNVGKMKQNWEKVNLYSLNSGTFLKNFFSAPLPNLHPFCVKELKRIFLTF